MLKTIASKTLSTVNRVPKKAWIAGGAAVGLTVAHFAANALRPNSEGDTFIIEEAVIIETPAED